ncbi:MAG: hypothetical protein K6G52_00590 [Treponemataceae bacterium]|nr:hypothetical protein [Treponemataceae bacterium]
MNMNFSGMNTNAKAKEIFLTEKKRDLFSAVATFVFCGILLVMFAIIPVKNKKYTEIRIQLNAPDIEKPVEKPPVQEKPVEKVEPVRSKTKTKTEQPKAAAKTVPTAKTPEAKTAPATKAPASKTPAANTAPAAKTPSPKVQQRKSIEEMMAENTSSKSSNKTFDDSLFDDFDEVSNTSSSQNTNRSVQTRKDTLSGSAASSTTTSSSATGTTTNARAQNLASNSTASSSTGDALGKIENAKPIPYHYSFSENEDSDVNYQYAPVGASRSVLSFEDISFSPAVEAQFTRSISVKIRVMFDMNGFVTGVTVSASPDALPLDAESEIKSQIRAWRFEPGTSDGYSEFNFKINVTSE